MDFSFSLTEMDFSFSLVERDFSFSLAKGSSGLDYSESLRSGSVSLDLGSTPELLVRRVSFFSAESSSSADMMSRGAWAEASLMFEKLMFFVIFLGSSALTLVSALCSLTDESLDFEASLSRARESAPTPLETFESL